MHQTTPIIFGIQGGQGSFNHQALLHYVDLKHIKKYQIEYLYTTRNVLAALATNKIQYGLFAIHNVLGGLVEESLQAIGHHKFTVVDQITIPITHHLMKHPSVSTTQLNTIMAHPQVFKQCQQHVQELYPHLHQVSGLGEYIDTARAAAALAQGELPYTTAILGPQSLADLYQLQMIARDLQDSENNQTTFLIVQP